MFLTIPREIRDTIYGYCSPPEVPAKTTFFQGRPAELGEVRLLRVCKQVHDEAAITYYGNKTFVFSIGWLEENRSNVTYFDNTAWLSAYYLRRTKRCIINVEAMNLQSDYYKTQFLDMKQQLQSFADRLGNHHSLNELRITYGTDAVERRLYWGLGWMDRLPRAARDSDFQRVLQPVQAAHNMLEPLGGIYGVASVTVKGAGRDLGPRLAGAIACEQKAVTPVQETYKTRLVKVKGKGKKKQAQHYRVSKYNDPKVIWNLDLIGPLVETTYENECVVATRKARDRSQTRVLDAAEHTGSKM